MRSLPGPALLTSAIHGTWGSVLIPVISRLAVLTVGVSLLVAGLLAPPSNAAAMPEGVTINLTAVVDLVDNPNGVPLGDIAPGDVITGSYTYNPKRKI